VALLVGPDFKSFQRGHYEINSLCTFGGLRCDVVDISCVLCRQCECFIIELITFKSVFHAPHCGLLSEAIKNVVTALCGSEAVSESKVPHKMFRFRRGELLL